MIQAIPVELVLPLQSKCSKEVTMRIVILVVDFINMRGVIANRGISENENELQSK